MGKVVQMTDRNAQARVRQAQAQARAQFGSMIPPLNWQPLTAGPTPEGSVGQWTNPRCKVTAWQAANPFGMPVPMTVIHVSEVGRQLTWEEMLQVIRETLGPEVEGVELFPAARRELGGNHVRYLWCLPAGQNWPIGKYPQAELDRRARLEELNREIGAFVGQHTLLVYLPEDPAEEIEIYVDHADAAAAGRTTSLRRMSMLDFEGRAREGEQWSAAARELRERVTLQVTQLVATLEQGQQDPPTIEDAPAEEVAPVAPTPEELEAAEAAAAAELEALRASLRKDDGE